MERDDQGNTGRIYKFVMKRSFGWAKETTLSAEGGYIHSSRIRVLYNATKQLLLVGLCRVNILSASRRLSC